MDPFPQPHDILYLAVLLLLGAPWYIRKPLRHKLSVILAVIKAYHFNP